MNTLNDMIVTKILEVSLRSHVHGDFYRIAKRPSYGLSFCTAGQIIYTLDGEKTISDITCAVIYPKAAHYTMYCNQTGRFPLVNFHCDTSFELHEFVKIPIKNLDQYLKLYENLFTLFPFEDKQAKCMALLYEIINLLCEEASAKLNPLAATMQYLEKHFTDPTLSNQTLSDHSQFSEVYFRQLFKQIYNTTPKQYILDLRLHKAKQLLSDRMISITEIAEQCGFSNVYHFCRSFKSHTGMTPTEYRLKNLRYELY